MGDSAELAAELSLAAEMIVDHRLVDAGLLGDRPQRHAVVAARRDRTPTEGEGASMATDAGAELRVDVHNIEPIPEADKDSTGPQQMWIWAGANIAPINWALGALGIVLKLGLWETIAVVVLGNIVGCAIFAAFTVMGHKTGVNQMVLGRSAFGRRGAYLPSVLMFLMTLGWIGVNTYFPVKIAVAILGQFGIGDTWLTNLIVVTVVMVIQVLIGIYGFYAIRTFEMSTVPVTAAF